MLISLYYQCILNAFIMGQNSPNKAIPSSPDRSYRYENMRHMNTTAQESR